MTDANGAAADRFAASGRVVIVGASLAGLYAAEALRKEGFAGRDPDRRRAVRAV